MERENPSSPAAREHPNLSSTTARSFRQTKWAVLLLVTLVSAGLDQWTKHWAHTQLRFQPGGRITIVENYMAFSYVRNPGAAWGFLARADESFRKPFFTIINLLAMAFILYIHSRLEPKQRLLLFALSLVMSGAVGNFIDRLRFNYVVDFIKVHLRDRFEWPTFNVADIAITVGVILLFAEMFISPYLERKRQQSPTVATGESGRSSVEPGSGSSADEDSLD
jgi:signal peptidase II